MDSLGAIKVLFDANYFGVNFCYSASIRALGLGLVTASEAAKSIVFSKTKECRATPRRSFSLPKLAARDHSGG